MKYLIHPKKYLLSCIFLFITSFHSQGSDETVLEMIKKQPDYFSGSTGSEDINMANGSLSFYVTDVDLPGNSKLPVTLGRRIGNVSLNGRSFLGGLKIDHWYLDIPMIAGITKEGNFPLITRESRGNNGWVGLSILIPGEPQKNLKLPIEGTFEHQFGYDYATDDNWVVKRIEQDEVITFTATSPEGHTYFFDYDVFEPDDKGRGVVAASEIKDAFGNKVTYSYSGNGMSTKLNQIESDDGRLISLTYKTQEGKTFDILDKVVVNGRTWLYESKDTGLKVTLPNDTFWEYKNITDHGVSKIDIGNCKVAEQFSSSISTPNGATITYIRKGIINGRYIPQDILVDPTTYEAPFIPAICGEAPSVVLSDGNANYSYTASWARLSTSSTAVIKRTITDINGDSFQTLYDYDEDFGSFGVDENFSTQKRRSITYPDGTIQRLYYDRSTTFKDGKLTAFESVDSNGNIISRTEMKYKKGGRHYYPISGHSPWGAYDVEQSYTTLLDEKITTTNLDSYTTRYFYNVDINKENYFFNKPYIITEFNSFSNNSKKVTKFNYFHDLKNWRLNLLEKESLSEDGVNFNEVRRIDYKAFNDSQNNKYTGLMLPYNQLKNGVLQYTIDSYNRYGNIKRIVYNKKTLDKGSSSNENVYINFSDYKRGIATTRSQSSRDNNDAIFFRQGVDDNGWVTRITDYNGISTNYTYDDMGRIKSVDLTNDAVNGNWYDTLYTWDNDTNTRTVSTCTLDSLRTACTGNAVFKTTEYYDSLLRLTKIKSQDLVNSSAANSTRYQRFEYNYLNQPTFQSYASANISENKGTTTVYDSLGRQQSITTSGLGTVNYAYLSGNRIELTNAKGHVTTTTYQAFGSPSYSRAVKIESPENVTTTLDIDIFGLTHAITQAGANQYGNSTSVTERRYYDNSKQLCLTTRPDVGNTLYKYNALGELIWSQSGVANTQCTSTAPSGSSFYTYDNLGSLKHVNYPDASGDVSYERDNNGNVKTLTAGNVIHRYEYNNQNLLEEEQLFVGNELPLILNYEYNALQQREQLGYPDGTIVNFKPNGFGESTEAQVYKSGNVDLSFAKSASYYANGTLSSFTYGNGVKHQTTLYADSLLPKQLKDTGPAGSNIPSTVMALTYDYDNNANVTSIIDSQNSAYSLTNLQYDSLDRLISTAGGSGIGSSEMRYDGLGNITYYKNKGKTLNYTYDYTKNRLSKVTGVSGRYGLIDYDDRGNIEHNGAYSLDFNAANQLTTAKGNSYLYDGHNRRVKQTDANGISYSMYSQDGTLLYREKGDTITGSGTNYIYLGKKLIAKYGDVTPQTLNESRQHARPFGESIEAPKDDVGYTGHKFDTDLGLSYMQARYYDPVIGRFYSNDPVGFTGEVASFNRYSYVGNNPYKYNDPDGKHRRHIAKQMAKTFERANKRAKQLQENKQKGKEFEEQKAAEIESNPSNSNVVRELTVKTKSGVKTRIDIVNKNSKGETECTECKSSDTAPLTTNQEKAFPEIAESGATVVGKGKPGFPGGTKIEPTKVDIVRPKTE